MAEKKKRHWLSRLSFGSVSLFMSSLLLLSYISVIVDPAKAWFFTLFGLLYPVVFPIVLVLFVWSLFRRSHMRPLLAIALLPSLFFAGRYYQLDRPSDLPEPTLKVVSYNVGLFAHSTSDTPRMALADSATRYLRGLDADIICLQEFWLPLGEQPEAWLQKHFPGYKAEYYVFTGQKGRFGNVTLSRRGFEGKGKETFEKSTNLAIYTDVKLDSSVLRLYNCHFESYNISLPALVKKDGAVEETERKMSRAISERPKQVAKVLKAAENSVVLGDFNDTPLSYTYVRFIRGRHDAFTAAGKGWGATHRSLWPFLRIDYILYPSGLKATSCTIDKVKYSDHYPVITSFYETGRNTR
ncbi:MAG: endonuclease/exonuclease/phosphatase family protein [Bacteroidales bacterium]|nr:endonuclease/exonuclease/phosphatase family protein [Bacteroidales bacterium]